MAVKRPEKAGRKKPCIQGEGPIHSSIVSVYHVVCRALPYPAFFTLILLTNYYFNMKLE
jgi:hypothetical protein